MKIIFSRRISKKELWSKPNQSDLRMIIAWYEKWIFENIKGESLPVGSKLIKVCATTVSGARRIVYLFDIVTHDVFFLFLRTKNDRIGENISIKNPEFKKKLKEYLLILSEDLLHDEYETIDCSHK